MAETKSEGEELRGSALMKIKCGIAHFAKFDDVKYIRVQKVSELTK